MPLLLTKADVAKLKVIKKNSKKNVKKLSIFAVKKSATLFTVTLFLFSSSKI